jgi:hypothetical protein
MAADRLAPLALAVVLALPATARATGPERPTATLAKPSRMAAMKAPADAALAWHDGQTRRPLTVDPTLEADFSPSSGGTAPVLRPAGSATQAAAAFVSPVLRDASGRARALPGGVLVQLAAPADDAEGRARIERAGARPARRLAETLWLVEGPVGLGSLELAERLRADGAFASVQPNWWVQRTLK